MAIFYSLKFVWHQCISSTTLPQLNGEVNLGVGNILSAHHIYTLHDEDNKLSKITGTPVNG